MASAGIKSVLPLINIYSAPSLPTVAWLEERLSDAGITCGVKNRFLSSGAGELPPTETWPTLFILDPGDEPRARKMVAEITDDSAFAGQPDWRCEHCGADNEAQFGLCWQCQHGAPQSS